MISDVQEPVALFVVGILFARLGKATLGGKFTVCMGQK